MAAYPGYVYHPYPRLLYHKSFVPPGYVVVNSEEEEARVKKDLERLDAPVGSVKDNTERPAVQAEKTGRKKLMFSEG